MFRRKRKVVAVLPVFSAIYDAETGRYDFYLKWQIVKEDKK